MIREFRGYTGTIVIDGEILYLTHHGTAGIVASLARENPRRIPLPEITDAHLKPATAFSSGLLVLGIGGQRIVSPSINDLNGVGFRRKENAHFQILFNWLIHVIQLNQAKQPGPGFPPTGVEEHPAQTAQVEAFAQNRLREQHDQELRKLKERIRLLETERAQLREELARSKEIDIVPEADPASPRVSVSLIDPNPGPPPTLPELAASARLVRLDPLEEQIEVAGETYHIRDIKRVFTDTGTAITTRGITLDDLECIYVPEPWNPHDHNAVAVMIGRYHVGYIPADIAEDYSEPLQRIAADGVLLTGTARIWAREEGGMTRARVTVLAPATDTLME